MRKLKRFCASLSLAIAFSIPALAGDIHTGQQLRFPQQPPPPPGSLVFETTQGGASSTTGTVSDVNDATFADPLTELAFALFKGLLFRF